MPKHFQADRYPITVPPGADFSKSWVYHPEGVDKDPKDWSGYTGKAQLRRKASATTALLDFTVTLGSDGTIELAASHTATNGLADGPAVWDLYITAPGGKVERFMAGPATIPARVTR